MDLFDAALKVAERFEVATPPDSIILYSISYLPTKRNRDLAFECISRNPQKMMIEHTPCGAELVKLGLWDSKDCGLDCAQIASVWKIASQRFIQAASGNVTAFVEGADPRSVFCSMELPNLLHNPDIETINGIDKYKFAAEFKG